jgi:CxxC motif-containing protein (DUF1111 family)
VKAGRRTPLLFGFGLLDAVPDSTILSYADPEDRNADGISGRPNRFFDGRLGRFGRKALVPTLREFNEGATVVEQGVTNPAVPTEESIGGDLIPPGVDPAPEPEIDQASIDAIDAFVRFLAPPAPEKLTYEGKTAAGRCSRRSAAPPCHVPTLETGESPIKALSHEESLRLHRISCCTTWARAVRHLLRTRKPSEFRTQP